jgi:DNA-binding NtrC family response regulator
MSTFKQMAREAVALLGKLSTEHRSLASLAMEFDWLVESAANLEGLRGLSAQYRLVAVLFDPKAMERPWIRAVQTIQRAAPQARLIVCQGFADSIPWPELADNGVFHSLALPLNEGELRQSLGFAWAAQRRREVNPFPVCRPFRTIQTPRRRATAVGVVA